MTYIGYPFDGAEILRKKRSLKKQLLAQNGLIEKRIAILSGSTVGHIADVLEIFLLSFGIRPQFYVGEYNRFYEDVMFENQGLRSFKPELICIHTSTRNLSDSSMWDNLQEVWAKIKAEFSCPVIQNNFELPVYGSEYDCRSINSLNVQIVEYAEQNRDFYINNIQHLSALFGLDKWFDEQDYFLYKYAFSTGAIPLFCHNIAKIIKSIFGKNKKCLVLDLDDTIWGGVVGDVGAMGIELGMESALGEAYTAFQKYAKSLHSRGVYLAVCSKNDEQIAKEAFGNPNMILRLDDIAVFCANWEDKPKNILRIAEQLNILPESIVFIDDNPAERDLVRNMLPDVAVPEVGSVVDFISHIEGAGYFYATRISDDDVRRNEYYASDIKRNEAKNAFANYGDYLIALNMSSTIRPFDSAHIDRITQLINKTNQFNLTTKRYSQSETESIASDDNFITLYATLDDKFGSNGIVSVLIGEIDGQTLHIRLWVMSCRVFKRELELAVFDCLVEACASKGVKKIAGYYFKTAKNVYVAHLLDDLGFDRVTDVLWEFSLTAEYQYKNKHIKIEGGNV